MLAVADRAGPAADMDIVAVARSSAAAERTAPAVGTDFALAVRMPAVTRMVPALADTLVLVAVAGNIHQGLVLADTIAGVKNTAHLKATVVEDNSCKSS